jgi:hypothetical protein
MDGPEFKVQFEAVIVVLEEVRPAAVRAHDRFHAQPPILTLLMFRMKITQTREFTETLSQRGVFCKMFFDRGRAAASLIQTQLILRRCEERSAEARKLRGMRSLLDSRTRKTCCSFSASLSLQSPHAFAIMSAVGIRRLRADGFPGKPADNFSFSLFNGG